MRIAHLDEMTKGWFVGDFEPSLYQTQACEVAVKRYQKGDSEAKHYHRIATEITVIIEGSVRMFDTVYSAGDIVIVEPGEATGFEALTDAVNAVVKIPGVRNDKYLVEEE